MSNLTTGLLKQSDSKGTGVLTIRLPDAMLKRLDTIANRTSKTRAKVARLMLDEGLREMENFFLKQDEIARNNAEVSKFMETCEEGLKNGGLTQN